MDFLATKGLEYLLVLGYLALLVPFWWLLSASSRRQQPAQAAARPPAADRPWFTVPEGFHFHRGHTWAQPDDDSVVRVGMDDFAHVLLGPVQGLDLPVPGSRLTAGEEGWKVQVDGQLLPVLAPVSGEVEEINEQAAATLGSSRGDPYASGWLMKIRVPSAQNALKNLMPDYLARAWTDETSKQLSASMNGELGTVLQDGGMPVPGLARELAGDAWRDFAARFLMSE